MMVSVFAAGINIVFNLMLVRPLAQGGLAFANTLSSAFRAAVLLWLLRKKLASTNSPTPVTLGGKAILNSLWRVLVAAGIMGVVVWFTHGALEIYVPGSAATAQLVRLGVSILVGVICYVDVYKRQAVGCSPVEPFGYIEIVESAGMAYYMSHFCTQRLLNRFEWFIT